MVACLVIEMVTFLRAFIVLADHSDGCLSGNRNGHFFACVHSSC